jgi:hypothetical protein
MCTEHTHAIHISVLRYRNILQYAENLNSFHDLKLKIISDLLVSMSKLLMTQMPFLN